MPLLAGTMLAAAGMPSPVCSGGTEATLTNPDSDGKNYRKHTFTTSGTLTVTTAGWLRYLVVGRGASGYSSFQGSGGRVREGWMFIPVGSHAVTVPAGGTDVDGAAASIGSLIVAAAVNKAPANGTGAGATTVGGATGHTSTISGSSVEYARRTGTSTNPGDGGPNAGTVVAGIVIVRYQI